MRARHMTGREGHAKSVMPDGNQPMHRTCALAQGEEVGEHALRHAPAGQMRRVKCERGLLASGPQPAHSVGQAHSMQRLHWPARDAEQVDSITHRSQVSRIRLASEP